MSICFGKSRDLSLGVLGAICTLFGLALNPGAVAQSATINSPAVLTQASQAFSSGKPVSSVEMTGTALVYEGGPPDEGGIALTADAKGQTELKLNLRKGGERMESQDSASQMMTCMWKKSDGVEHKARGIHCQTPLVWFLPMMTMQTPNTNQELTVSDLGINSGDKPRHGMAVQFSSPRPDASNAQTTNVRPARAAKLDLDSNSLLPGSYRYSLPAANSTAVIEFEIRFSDYRKIGDTHVPFLIQRYVNGALQLEAHISEAHITN